MFKQRLEPIILRLNNTCYTISPNIMQYIYFILKIKNYKELYCMHVEYASRLVLY